MSSTSPIGIFDSGVGGLSILREIRRLLLTEDLIYLADSAHCPYGVKSIDEIRQRVLEVTGYLAGLGVKIIVVACNTACVAGLDQIRTIYPDLPIVGVEPAIKPAQSLTRNGKIGVLATNLTLKGTRFSILVDKYGSGIEVYTQPAPGLVELVEAGSVDTPETETLLHKYLDSLLEKQIDTLVLGCTHYPFLTPLIQKICGPGVTILDTGLAVARQTVRVIEQRLLGNPVNESGQEIFYTTGDQVAVGKVIQKLWPKSPLEVIPAKF